MGRVIKRECVAIRCELATRRRTEATCDAVVEVTPLPVPVIWEDQLRDLSQLVRDGWSLLLTPKMRAYCPAHAARIWDCSCRTNRDFVHQCPSHGEAKDLVWTDEFTPEDVTRELTWTGAAL